MRLNVRRYIVLGMVGLAACGSSVAPKGPETSRAAPAAAPATAAPTASGSATASAPTSAAATPSGDGSKFCQLSKQQFDRIPELMAKIPNATANDAKKLLDEVAAESATIVASAPSSLKADRKSVV